MTAATAAHRAHPSVTVVVPTRNRPDLLRRTLRSILEQEYPGDIAVLVVFDQSPPDHTLASAGPGRSVSVLENARTSGLAGARNTGVLAATGDLVAFCDDDDLWRPRKLQAQVQGLESARERLLVTCGIAVRYGDRTVERPLQCTSVALVDLLRSRLTELHPSTFLFRREEFIARVGLVDESIPGSYAEDYELLLRAARAQPVLHVREVHVDVLWHQKSYFSARWEMIASALQWLLDRYPEFASVPQGQARVSGQIAFAYAAQGRRRDAWRWATRTLRCSPREGRAYLAVAVASGVVGADRVLATLHRRGRGI